MSKREILPLTDDQLAAERRLVAAYRAADPSSRIVSIVKYATNTGSRKSECCVLCGAEGPTWSAKYPKTKCALAWARDHVALHAANVDAELVALDALCEGRKLDAARILGDNTLVTMCKGSP
jgi:hypothetical protein